MGDLVFHGGMIGATLGNQQFTSRNMSFDNCQQAINQAFDWGKQSTFLPTLLRAFLHIGFTSPNNSISRYGKYAYRSADCHILTTSRLDIQVHHNQQLQGRLEPYLWRPFEPGRRFRNIHRQQH